MQPEFMTQCKRHPISNLFPPSGLPPPLPQPSGCFSVSWCCISFWSIQHPSWKRALARCWCVVAYLLDAYRYLFSLQLMSLASLCWVLGLCRWKIGTGCQKYVHHHLPEALNFGLKVFQWVLIYETRWESLPEKMSVFSKGLSFKGRLTAET